ncbi:MAG: hypothetical protein HYY49_09995 [Ignavibacteriales bacterium]|nr:hypothetical protein [Ignavibacteriales bacterium]
MKPWWLFKILKVLVIVAVATLAIGYIVMELWNALIPELFKGPSLTFWQAVGLLVLSHILLRGWGRWRYANGWRHDRWKKRFEEKLAGMTPEEQAKFKEEWKRRCGWYPGMEEERKEQTRA